MKVALFVRNTTLLIAFFAILGTNLLLISKLYIRSQIINTQTQLLTEIAKTESVRNDQYITAAAPLVLGAIESEVKLTDSRADTLRHFFRKHNSPLYDYADIFVSEADAQGLDYRLLPAIAMQESNLGRKMPENSFNPFGWGITGQKVLRFTSYEEAIKTVAKGIREQYVDRRGLKTASEIMRVYTPASTGTWAYAVNYFMRLLE